MSLKIALAGNPNSGKTTMFNALTGSNQYVGNWPGVTVEKKEGKLKSDKEVIIQDLPGIYSLSPYTLEEVISRVYLVEEKPDAIINIIDGTNIERNLYLTTQLLELNIPVVIAVNMIDVVRKNGNEINIEKLGEMLGCQVVETSALKREGSDKVAQIAVEIAKSGEKVSLPPVFDGSVEHAIAHIEEILELIVKKDNLRWLAVKLFERDEKVLESLKLEQATLDHINEHIVECEKDLDDDSESIIINQRYSYISKKIKQCVKKQKKDDLSISDKIDLIVTNRFLSIPIFAGIIFLVYYISVTTLGATLTDWTNGVLVEEWICGGLGTLFENMHVSGWLSGLIVDGIVGGVGAVIGFVPQILLVSMLLAILEDVGYMSRIAFIMDRLFRRFGLSGKSFIPMLVGSGCGVPGVMASRTIENESDRRMTVMTTTFVPCAAKLPIIALIAGALFGGAGWVAPSAYFVGLAAIVVSGVILKKTKMFSSEPSPFVMELPAYHVPSVRNVLKATWERGWSFIKRAGTIILVSAVVLWFLQGYGIVDGALSAVDDNNTSLLAAVGRFFAPIFAPLGFGTWQATVGTVTGLIAKEEVVGTLGVLYGFAEVAEDGVEYWKMFAKDFTAISAYAFLVFNLLCAPCFAAIGAIKREMNNKKWTTFAIGYQCVFAYVVAMIVYQFGTFFTVGSFGVGTGISVVLFAGLLYLLFRKNPYKNKNTIDGVSVSNSVSKSNKEVVTK